MLEDYDSGLGRNTRQGCGIVHESNRDGRGTYREACTNRAKALGARGIAQPLKCAVEEVPVAIAEFTTRKNPQSITAFHHILVATDYSEASRRALAAGLSLAAANNAQLSVIHVAHSDWRHEMLERPPQIEMEGHNESERLRAFIDENHPERLVNAMLVKSGSVARAVMTAIAHAGVDLLVIGTRGRGGLTKLALGSVAEELLRTASCPVMTIGPKAGVAASFHAILFATDFGRGSTKAAPLAVGLAKMHRAKLILLHTLAPAPMASSSLSAFAPAGNSGDEVQEWEQSSRQRGLRELRECIPPDSGLEQEPEFIVGTDFLPEAIMMAAEKYKADLIVMGANHARSRFAARYPWTAVHEVVRNARCPIVTVAG